MMLKGMTAQFLLRQTFKVEKGQTILWHAAAGGVGLIACQWAKHLDATVIGTTSSEEKAKLAREHGCDHVIDYTKEDVAERVKEITNGRKLPVVYDGVGKATFLSSLDSLAPLGLLVSFGNASGPVTDVNLGILAQKGSLYVTRPTMYHYAAKTPTAFQEMADDLFAVVKSGAVKIEVNQRYSLAEAARAHLDRLTENHPRKRARSVRRRDGRGFLPLRRGALQGKGHERHRRMPLLDVPKGGGRPCRLLLRRAPQGRDLGGRGTPHNLPEFPGARTRLLRALRHGDDGREPRGTRRHDHPRRERAGRDPAWAHRRAGTRCLESDMVRRP